MKALLLYLLLTVLPHVLFSQPDTLATAKPKNGIVQRVKTDGHLTIKTIAQTYTRPFHWKKKEWLIFSTALGVSAASTLLDEPFYDYTKNNKTPFLNDLASVGDFLGQPENNYPFMLALWGSGAIANNEWLRDTGIMLFASVTTSGLIQTASKELVGRARPATDVGPYAFKPFGGVGYHSFPSGHTMLSVATSWILARQINWIPGKVVFFTLPVIVGGSRIYDGAHWFSDIVLGSALGIACAEAVVNIYPKLKESAWNQRLSIAPTPSGFSLSYKL